MTCYGWISPDPSSVLFCFWHFRKLEKVRNLKAIFSFEVSYLGMAKSLTRCECTNYPRINASPIGASIASTTEVTRRPHGELPLLADFA
jgi:hypothetical protein